MSSVTAPGGMLGGGGGGGGGVWGRPGSLPPVLPSAFRNRRPVHEIGIPSEWPGQDEVAALLLPLCLFPSAARGNHFNLSVMQLIHSHADHYKHCLSLAAAAESFSFGVPLQF